MGKQHQAATVSPQRAALAAAVSDKRDDDARRASIRTAHAESIERVYASRDAVEQAQAALEQAKRDAANYLVDLGMGRDVAVPVSIQAARHKLVGFEDDLEVAEETRAMLQQQADAIDNNAGFAGARLKEAAVAVVRVEAAEHAHVVAETVAALQRDLVRYGTELRWLAGAGVFPWNEAPGLQYHHVQDPNIAATLTRLDSPPSTWNELARVPDLQGHVLWAEAMVQLSMDPNANLPVK